MRNIRPDGVGTEGNLGSGGRAWRDQSQMGKMRSERTGNYLGTAGHATDSINLRDS